MKTCTKCNQEKELIDFPKSKQFKDGFHSWCKVCMREKSRLWRLANPEREKERIREWEARTGRTRGAYKREWRKKNPERSRRSSKKTWLKYRYNLTLEEYEAMLEEQDRRCKICGDHCEEVQQGLAVDHNHATGKVRGLLCHRCNRGLGLFRESQESLQKAILYLQEFQ